MSLAPTYLNTDPPKHFYYNQGQFQAEGAAGKPAGGAARSSLLAGLKKRESQPHYRRSGTKETANEKRYYWGKGISSATDVVVIRPF